jgi:hypothetical protein
MRANLQRTSLLDKVYCSTIFVPDFASFLNLGLASSPALNYASFLNLGLASFPALDFASSLNLGLVSVLNSNFYFH